MASMYFFIPIHGLRKKCVKDFERNRKPVKNSDFVKNTKIVCHYADLNVSQTFYYTYKKEEDKTNEEMGKETGDHNKKDNETNITRQITLNVSLLSYTPNHNKKARQFFIVVNATIDKTFSDEPRTLPNNPIDPTQICTEDDLAYLKHAFYEQREEGLYYPANTPTIFLHSWILEVINNLKLCRKRLKSVSFNYSITDLKSAAMDLNSNAIKIWKDLILKFNRQYCHPNILRIHPFAGNQYQFCAALLNGNINYERMPQEHVDAVVRNSFTNNISERTYIDKYNFVFYHWHHPFKEKTTCADMPTLNNLQHIHELCTVVYARHCLRMIRYWANQNKKSNVIEALTRQMAFLNQKLFNLEAIDNTMTHIYRVMGVRHEMETTKELCLLMINKKDTSTSQRLNYIITILTAYTVLFAILQLTLQFIEPMSLFPAHCCHDCSQPVFDCLPCGIFCLIGIILIPIICVVVYLMKVRIKKWLNKTTVKTIYEIEQED